MRKKTECQKPVLLAVVSARIYTADAHTAIYSSIYTYITSTNKIFQSTLISHFCCCFCFRLFRIGSSAVLASLPISHSNTFTREHSIRFFLLLSRSIHTFENIWHVFIHWNWRLWCNFWISDVSWERKRERESVIKKSISIAHSIKSSTDSQSAFDWLTRNCHFDEYDD